jgi:hypothetical protein
MTSTLRNNLLVHWAIPVKRTISVHACDKICLSEDYSPLPIEAHAVVTRVEIHFNRQNPRVGRRRKTFFHNLLEAPLLPLKIRLIPHIMNPFYA